MAAGSSPHSGPRSPSCTQTEQPRGFPPAKPPTQVRAADWHPKPAWTPDSNQKTPSRGPPGQEMGWVSAKKLQHIIGNPPPSGRLFIVALAPTLPTPTRPSRAIPETTQGGEGILPAGGAGRQPYSSDPPKRISIFIFTDSLRG